ncbi:MAG: alanine racemase, partial [Sphingobacteriales bacterium]
ITVNWRGQTIDITIPFTDAASTENAIHCFCVMLYLGINQDQIRARMKLLNPVAMRLEMKSGINNSSVINDSYSSDLSSLRIALDFMSQQKQHARRTVILSDILQSGRDDHDLYREVAGLLQQHKVNRLIGIGASISKSQHVFSENKSLEVVFFDEVASFKKAFPALQFRDETVLIKGARIFALEGIDQLLQQKVHQTVLEINLTAIVHNLNEYRKILSPATKVMAMVKAFSYGSGSFEISNLLQFYKTDYLAVAYADEGVALRKAGIGLPIMVMNTDNAGFDVLVEYHLEPNLYSFEIFNQFSDYLRARNLDNFPVHLEMETGMNRLGFGETDLESLAKALNGNSLLRIRSVFSHLAASEDPAFDAFTSEQFSRFNRMAAAIREVVGYPFLKHISNTAGVSRHAGIQLDMVRLGIGLYGIDNGMKPVGHLREVSTLKSTVAQIKHLAKSDTVGYGRRGRLTRDSVIATVRLGYADGYSRKMGNGRGQMIVGGKRAPVVGSICMDMTMIDITDIPGVSVGDEVIVFGAALPVQELAVWAETIPYEILTGISQRVKRVYFEE